MPMTTPAAGEQIEAPERVPSGCPVIHLDASAPLEAGSHWSKANELRETSPAFFNTHAQGYWVFTRYDEVREMYQHPEIFSSESITPWEPDPVYRFVPTQIDPPEHAKYRQLISRWFAPNAVGRIAPAGARDRPAPGRRPRAAGGVRLRHRLRDAAAHRDLPDHHRRAQLGRRPVRPVGGGLLRRLRRRPRAAAGDGRGPRRDPAVLGGSAGGSPRRGAAPRERLRLPSPALHRGRAAAGRRPDPGHPHRARPGRPGHDARAAGLPVPPPRRPPRRPAPAARRAGADPVGGRGVAAPLHDHLRRRPQGRRGHRVPRLPAPQGRHGLRAGLRRQPGPAGLRPPGRVRRGPQGQQPPRLRRRPAPVPRRAPGPHGHAGRRRGVAEGHPRLRGRLRDAARWSAAAAP